MTSSPSRRATLAVVCPRKSPPICPAVRTKDLALGEAHKSHSAVPLGCGRQVDGFDHFAGRNTGLLVDFGHVGG
jgi:hypothetical protein